MILGDWVGDDYQLTDQAPLDFIRVSRTRTINRRMVQGSWSDPWWAWSHAHGWAIIRRWKNKEYAADKWSEAVPAMDVLVFNEVGPDNTLGPEMES